MKFYPDEKRGGGAQNVFAMMKGGGAISFFWVALALELEVLAVLNGGGVQKVPPPS